MNHLASATLPSCLPTSVLSTADALIAELEESLVLTSVADIIVKCFSPDPLRQGPSDGK